MDIGQPGQKSEPAISPTTNIQLKMLGSRINGASMAKGYLYLALAGVALAIISQYTSMQWAKYAKDNYKPNYIFMDPSGSAFLVESPKKDKPVVSEDVIFFSLWQVVKAQYEAVGDTAVRHANHLINYYLDGGALESFRKNSDNPNILGTAAEKAQLIGSGYYRYIELRSRRLHNATTLDNGAQKILAELKFHARTYKRGSVEPISSKTFRVNYAFTIMGPLKNTLDSVAKERFLIENPIRLRLQSFNLQDENPGTQIPLSPENQSFKASSSISSE